MNLQEKHTLWIKIQNFPLDEPGATVNFSQKLAQQQNWSPAFTKRVIEEYRKFILLCCVSEKGASPSKAVDEAWHLHLTYTKSYWINFCKNTLGKEIHHHPSKGGADEDHKHEDWYNETLQLYQKIFGLAPPTDIWPKPQEYQHIIGFDGVPKTKNIHWAAAIIALPFLFTGILYGKLNPFTLTGPEFLAFYALFGLAIIIAYIVRQNTEKAGEMADSFFPENATVFQIARFLYGKHRAVQTAIVDLIRRDLLKVNADKSILVLSDKYIPVYPEENPLTATLVQQPHCSKTDYETIAANWYHDEQFAHPALDNLNELGHRERPFMHQGVFYVILLATGVMRMIQGVYNHRPVIFLFFEMLVLAIVLYMVMNRVSVKNALFKKAEQLFMEKLRQQKGHADYLVNEFVTKGAPSIAGFAEGYLLMAVFTANDPVIGKQWRESSVWGSSVGDGGSSCSGGGGSCGGGGCGGCGGGD